MDLLHIGAVFVVGVVVGFINVLAAGGSFVTLAVLIALGLPPTVANGTNRVGLLIQNTFASFRFHRLNILKHKFVITVAPFAVAGSLVGSYMATHISDELFKRIIAVLMVVVSFVTIYRPQRFSSGRLAGGKKLLVYVVFFLIGVYGGFAQAGVGFFIITASVWSGFSMVEANSVKVFLIMLYTIVVLPIFFIAGEVEPVVGVVLGLGSMIGARIAIGVSLKKGERFIRAAVLVFLLIFAIKLMLFG